MINQIYYIIHDFHIKHGTVTAVKSRKLIWAMHIAKM